LALEDVDVLFGLTAASNCRTRIGAFGRARSRPQRSVEPIEAAVAAVTDELAALRAEVAALRAEHEGLVDELNDELGKMVDKSMNRMEQQGDEIRVLKSELADVRVQLAAVRTEELKDLHANLIAAAGLTIRTFNEAASRRAGLTEVETARHEELAEIQAKADRLADQLESLKAAQRNFKFAREQDDSDVLDLPAFLPPPSRAN
jgi:chromosome segregation ATPase